MPRKKKLSAAEQAQKEAEAMASTIRTDGQGEHPAIQALMSPEFEKMSNLDASQIALMLQQIIRGEMSMISQQNNIQIAQLRERQDKVDQDIASRFESQQKFIEEVLDRAEKIQRTGEAKDRLIANGVAEYTKAKHNAVADLTTSNLAFRRKLISEKKVPYISPGQLVTVMENGQQVARIIPEEVHIKDIHMRVPVGVPIEIPATIAKYLDQRRASQLETAKRAELLSKNMESGKLAQEWGKIEGSKTEAMPI